MTSSLESLADAYLKTQTPSALSDLRSALDVETSLNHVVHAAQIVGKVPQEDTQLIESVIRACDRIGPYKEGPENIRFAACDAVYAMGNTNKKHLGTALIVLKWVRQCSNELGPSHSSVLVNSGLVRLTLSMGGKHVTSSKEVTVECLKTLLALVQNGNQRTQKQLKLMGVREYLHDVKKNHSASKECVQDVDSLIELLGTTKPPSFAGFCCFAFAASYQLDL